MIKITHKEIDELNSLQSHPGWKTFVLLIQEKINALSRDIDTLETKKKDLTYNNTEVHILRKSYLNEVANLPNEITEWFKVDSDIRKANKQVTDFLNELEDETK